MNDTPLDNERLIGTAETLSEALPYMQQFAGETFVIKYGGHAMGDEALARQFARDVVLIKQVGINPVIVHGGGPQIGAMLERLQIESTFVEGLRVTDAKTVEIVEMVLAGSINKQVVTAINQAGGVAIGLSGKDGGLVRARRVTRTVKDPDSNIEKVLDLGFVGEPEAINAEPLHILARSNMIPVVAPIGVGADGASYNINADTVAGAIAAELKACRLIMLTDVAGVMDASGTLLKELSYGAARDLIADGTISGGMIPKVECCLSAVDSGVGAATIVDGRVPHVILLETFTEAGVGTQFVPD